MRVGEAKRPPSEASFATLTSSISMENSTSCYVTKQAPLNQLRKIFNIHLKAQEAQNHNSYAKMTPSHLSILVEHLFFASLVIGGRGKRALYAENEARSVDFSGIFF